MPTSHKATRKRQRAQTTPRRFVRTPGYSRGLKAHNQAKKRRTDALVKQEIVPRHHPYLSTPDARADGDGMGIEPVPALPAYNAADAARVRALMARLGVPQA